MYVNEKIAKACSQESSHKGLKVFGVTLALLAVSILSACTSTQDITQKDALKSSQPRMPAFNDTLFKLEKVVDFDQITRLNKEQKKAFLEFYNDPKFTLTPPSTRVATYLGLLLDQFTYSDKTFTAQQTLDNLEGNCLSLTVLSTALAELADVDIHFQLLDQNPVFSMNENLLVTSDHLRAVLKSRPEIVEGEAVERVSFIRIDYFDTDGLSFVDEVSVNTQKSLFYSNLAIEKLADKKIDSAYSYAKKALEIYPANASALNAMGILHRQRGDVALAESVYAFGARYYAKAPMFVRNYKNLLASQGRVFDLNNVLPVGDDSHPWEWVRAGKAAFNGGEYDEAVAYYEEALAIAPDIHQVYLFAGQASLAAGKRAQSKQFFIDAYKLSNDAEEKTQYKRKLLALKGRMN